MYNSQIFSKSRGNLTYRAIAKGYKARRQMLIELEQRQALMKLIWRLVVSLLSRGGARVG